MKENDKRQNATFTCQDYREVVIPGNSVIYADPPYANTTGYGGEKFDSVKFWEYARGISKNHLLFIKATEKLFIHNSKGDCLKWRQ